MIAHDEQSLETLHPLRVRVAPVRILLPATAAAAVVLAVRDPRPIAVVAALALVTIAAALTRLARPPDPRAPISLGVGILLLSSVDGGLAGAAGSLGAMRLGVVVAAYALLALVLLEHVSEHHLVRASDLFVDAVLVGAATTVLLQVSVAGSGAAGQRSLHLAAPSLLIGLDIALVVIVTRTLSLRVVRSARGLALPVAGVGIALLAVAHALSMVAIGDGTAAPGVAAAAAAVGIGLVCGASLLVFRGAARAVPTTEPPLFSVTHAGVLVVSVLASPVLLAAQAMRDVPVSATVATGSVVSAAVLGAHMVRLLRERAQSEHQATHDPLTGAPNRLLFVDRLERALAHAERNGSPVGVIYIDLDRFKDVNDTLGHGAGDVLLCTTAERLAACGRNEDTVARLSGDEFAILLPHVRAADDVPGVARRMLAALAEPIELAGHRLRCGGSVGVAVFPQDGATPDQLLAAADAAMYVAKERGGSSIELFSAELAETAVSRLETETELHDAIDATPVTGRGDGPGLELHLQPIVDARSGRTCGAEALIRWHHPERGFLNPGAFVPVAEQSELIVELGEWVIASACHHLAELAAAGFDDVFLTVNVSSRHFRHDLVSAVAGALRATGADPRRLMIELTEDTAVDDLERVAATLRELRNLGVRAAIDDFGTGYCGLQYLGDLPVNTLKIDRSFVQAMTPRSAAIVAATIAMGRSLGMSIVAEGVETEEQRRFLVGNGCDRLQGFHLGRPAPVADLFARLAAERAGDDLAADPPMTERPPEPLASEVGSEHTPAVPSGATTVAS